MNKIPKIVPILFVIVLLVVVVEVGFYLKLKKDLEKTGVPVSKEFQITPVVKTDERLYLEGEVEPEVLGNEEEPIDYLKGAVDSEGTRNTKYSQFDGAATLIKGVVLVRNDVDRTLTLKHHLNGRIKISVPNDVGWLLIDHGERSEPEDFWNEIRVWDYINGYCVDSQCSAVDYVVVSRS